MVKFEVKCEVLHKSDAHRFEFYWTHVMSYSGVTHSKGDPEVGLKFDKWKRLPKLRIGEI